jgi:endonuclease G
MSTREEQLQLLRQLNNEVRESDPELGEESVDLAVRPESTRTGDPMEDGFVEESIVLRSTRPVLPILNNETRLVFVEQADSKVWTDRLTKAQLLLAPAIRAVGRVNLKGAPLGWVGTGWIVAENVVVTNRHVAEEFAMHDGESFTFESGAGGPVSADLDFLQEIDNPARLVFRLVRPLYIQERPGPDVAFFEIEPISGEAKLAAPIPLAAKARKTASVAVIGYPASDSRIREPALMERIFGGTYNKKRLAPGAVTSVEEYRILHNCTTLGGNSGSALIDLETGEALGLHFSGTFLTANYAVPANVVKAILDDVRGGRMARWQKPAQKPLPSPPPGRPAPELRVAGGAGTSITIPLTVTVTVG